MTLDALFNLLRGCGAAESKTEGENPIHLATAGILLELAHADQQFTEREEQQLLQTMTETFGLTEARARQVIGRAEETRASSIDHWSFTSRIKDATDHATRLEIVRAMWRVVLADGRLHEYEEYLVRKLSDLLGIQHHEMIEAKLAVRKEIAAP